MFVRKKGAYYYLAESRREGGKVKQRVLCYLSTFPTVQEALGGWADLIKQHQEKAAAARMTMETCARALEPYLRWHMQKHKLKSIPRPHWRRWGELIWYDILLRYWDEKKAAEWHDRQATLCGISLDRLKAVLQCSA